MGQCTEETQIYLSCSLKRELTQPLKESATHILFRKIPVALLNRQELDSLAGELLTFEAAFENDNSNCISWPGVFKRGCKVMLVWNMSNDLKNGGVGVFKGMRGDALLVFFDGVGEVEIGRKTWIKTNRYGQRVGSVTQFPIVLAYAVTCHKAQGLTLSSAIVHCSREYVSGLIYVAISRVRSPEHIQVLDFNPRQLMKPQQKALETCTSRHLSAPVEDLSCCRHKRFGDKTLLTVKDRFQDVEEDDVHFSFPSEIQDGRVRALLEDDDVDVPMDLMEMYSRLLAHESSLATPPAECYTKCQDFLTGLKTNDPVSTFVEDKNNALDTLLTESSPNRLKSFTNLVWFHFFLMVENHIKENPDEIVVDISRQAFTDVTGRLHEFFTCNDFTRYLCSVFDVAKCTPVHRAVGVQLATSLYWQFLEHLADVVKLRRQEIIPFDVQEMSEVGKSKIRRVGGWAVRKVLNRARKHILRNVNTNSRFTLASVKKQQLLCELLEENIIQPYAMLEESSKFPETLEVTEARQYRQRGLLHISDEAYLFFLKLEKRRVELLNLYVLNRAREEMVELALVELRADQELKDSWLSCFELVDEDKNKVMNNFLLRSWAKGPTFFF